jgi:outer membrane protein
MSFVAGWGGAAKAQDHVLLGVGAVASPTYQGADDYRLRPIPAIDIKKGWFFANFRNGVGVAPISTDRLTVGAGVVFVQGYRQRDVPKGVARLSSAAGGRLFASLRTGGFVTTVGVVKALSGGTKGVVADASLSYPLQVSSRFSLTPTVGATWADGRHNDRYFGVTAAEALASGLSRFRAGAGFKDATAALTASYRLTDRITFSATGGATSLLGPVKDSPLVVHKIQPLGILSFTYRM